MKDHRITEKGGDEDSVAVLFRVLGNREKAIEGWIGRFLGVRSRSSAQASEWVVLKIPHP